MGPWWDGGLPFACTMCGKCCHARGDVAHVYVNRREVDRLARHLGMEREEFLDRYTEPDGEGHRTLRFERGRCVFLDGARCRVHEAKPTQCRTWPFWPELLESPESYEREVRSFCPGSRSGPAVPPAEIARRLRATEAAFHEDADGDDAAHRG